MNKMTCAMVAFCLSAPAMTEPVTAALTALHEGQATTTPAAAILDPSPVPNILRAGTEIPLIMREELTTKAKKLRVGQRFQMEVASNVIAGNTTVIPAGTPAIGEITEIRNKGMWGKSGYIGARIVSLRMGDRHIRLSGTFDDKGVTGTGGVIAAVAFLPVAGFFTTGTSAFIASGSGVKAFLDEDIAFRPVPTAPQVVDVSVPQGEAMTPAVLAGTNIPE